MIIGFNKHVDFYERVPSCTVIARSEATWQSASQTLRFSERFRENDPCKGKRIAAPVCALARNDSVF